ncbi:MAG: hypothetical protein ACTSUE_15900 [Promethearchaeota archaeon]
MEVSQYNDVEFTSLKLPTRCSVCGQEFKVHVTSMMLDEAPSYPFPHVILHGSPIHAHVVYIDKQGRVRGGMSSTSLQIDKTSSTFQELVKWWTLNVEDNKRMRP